MQAAAVIARDSNAPGGAVDAAAVASGNDSAGSAAPVASSPSPAPNQQQPQQQHEETKKQKKGNDNGPPLGPDGQRLYPRKQRPQQKKQKQKHSAAQSNGATVSGAGSVTQSSLALRRWAQTCCTYGSGSNQRIIAFGGWGSDLPAPGKNRSADHRLNTVAILHPSQGLIWNQPSNLTGTPPIAREQHTAVIIPAAINDAARSGTQATEPQNSAASTPSSFSSLTSRTPHLLVYGGRSNPSKTLADVALLSLPPSSSSSSAAPSYHWHSLPAPTHDSDISEHDLHRCRHSAVWSDHRLIVYGGCRFETWTTWKERMGDASGTNDAARTATPAGNDVTAPASASSSLSAAVSSVTLSPPPAAPPTPVTPCTIHTVYNDILVLDTSRSPMHWRRIHPKGYAPSKPCCSLPMDMDIDDSHNRTTNVGTETLTASTSVVSAPAASSVPVSTTAPDTLPSLPSLPYKHTHATTFCSQTNRMFIFGGFGSNSLQYGCWDPNLYVLHVPPNRGTTAADETEEDGWEWECLQMTPTWTSGSSPLHMSAPPPLASASLHVLSPRFLLLLGGVSGEDLHAVGCAWMADLQRKRWSRVRPTMPTPTPMPQPAGNPPLKAIDAPPITDTCAAGKQRIINNALIIKHGAVIVDWECMSGEAQTQGQGQIPASENNSLSSSSSSSSSLSALSLPPSISLLICGGGGNVFHFNPYFNPTLLLRLKLQLKVASAVDEAFQTNIEPNGDDEAADVFLEAHVSCPSAPTTKASSTQPSSS